SDFPDGGKTSWTVLFGAWAVLFCSFGLVQSIGVFQEYYTRGPLRQYPSSTIAWITSVEVWTQNFFGVPSGLLYDRFGPKWLMVGGSLLYVFGLMMTSLAEEYYQIFLAQSLVTSLGASACFNAAMSSVATWFCRRRALAFGIMMSGSSVSGIVLPVMVSQLSPRVGFPWAVRLIGFMAIALLSVSCVTVKSRIPPKPQIIVFKRYLEGLREPVMALTISSMFLFFWGMFVVFNFILLQAQRQGVSPKLVDYLLPIMNGASIFGRIIPTLIADKAGRLNMTILMSFLTSVFCLALWIPGKSDVAIILFSIIFGFSTGGFVALAPALVAQISRIEEVGIRTGSAFAISSFGSLTGSPLAGAIVAASGGSFLGLQLFSGFTCLGATIALVVARYLHVGWKMEKV
ncbi:major facilitator superfamily domain-containing protein, partial [Dactylonectria macrodidyma]